MPRIFLSPFLVAASLFIYSPVYAQVRPETLEVRLTVKPGEKISRTIMLYNDSKAEQIVKVSLGDVIFPSPFKGLRDFRPLGSTTWSCGKWISLSAEDLLIPPSGKYPFTYTISVPSDAKGGYYGILFFESVPSIPGPGVGMSLQVKVGCTFYLETPDSVAYGTLGDVSAAKDGLESSLLNSGNALLIARVTYHIMDKRGTLLKRAEPESYYIPPGETATFSMLLPKDLPIGEYNLLINCDSGKTRPLVKEVRFTKDVNGALSIGRVND